MRSRTTSIYVSERACCVLLPGGRIHRAPHPADCDTFGGFLREQGAPRRIHLVLSALQCRFLVLPWVSSCGTAAAMRAYVTESFAENESVIGDTHRIEIDWPRHGHPVFAVAYPREPVETLAESLRRHGFNVLGVESSVGPMLARHVLASHEVPALFAYAEEDGVTGVTLDAAGIAAVETLYEGSTGLAGFDAWASRKRFAFSEDGRMHWLGDAPMPSGYRGIRSEPEGDAAVSAARAILEACQ